ncbi:MAG: hypothetical protein ACREBR_04490 [bacterium]
MKRGPKSKKFCRRGHNKDVVGRDTHGKCVKCKTLCTKKWQKSHKEYIIAHDKFYYKNNKEKIRNKCKKYNDTHRKELNEYTVQYRKDHPALIRALNLKAATNRNLRIVAWTDWDNIKEFNENMPKGMTEDHIIPLQGKLVSGLHVSWNLQSLTLHDNKKKYRKINLLEASNWYGKILEKVGLK